MGYDGGTMLERAHDSSASGRELARELQAAISLPDPKAPGGVRTGLNALAYYLTELMFGRDPAADQRGGAPVDWATRRWAGREFLDRVVGRPKAHVIVGGDGSSVNVRLEQADVAVSVLDCREVAAIMPPAELEVLARAREIGVRAAREKLDKLVRYDQERRRERPQDVGRLPAPRDRPLPMIDAESKPVAGR